MTCLRGHRQRKILSHSERPRTFLGHRLRLRAFSWNLPSKINPQSKWQGRSRNDIFRFFRGNRGLNFYRFGTFDVRLLLSEYKISWYFWVAVNQNWRLWVAWKFLGLIPSMSMCRVLPPPRKPFSTYMNQTQKAQSPLRSIKTLATNFKQVNIPRKEQVASIGLQFHLYSS